jgi:hypothetical protein
MREAHHTAAGREGILQFHDFARITGRASGESDLLGGYRGGGAGAEAEREDDGEGRDDKFHIVMEVDGFIPNSLPDDKPLCTKKTPP